MRTIPLPQPQQLGPDPEAVPTHRVLVLARMADEGFEPTPPVGILRLVDVADPDHEASSPNPLVSPSYRESLLPVAEHAGAV